MRSSSVLLAALAAPLAAGQNFNPANLVIWRMGDGSVPAIASNAQPYFVDEYSVAADGSSASLVRTIAMPTTGTTACTGSGTTIFEGAGSLAFDGRTLATACFTGPVGTATVSSTTSFPMRQVNRIAADGSMKFIRYSDSGTGNIRGVVTFNGTDFWMQAGGGVRLVQGGAAFDATPNGGLFTTTNYPSLATMPITSMRALALAANTPDTPVLLVGYSAAASLAGIYSLGSGLPVTATSLVTQLNATTVIPGGMGSLAAFHVQDVNTLWAASATALYKFVAAPRAGTLRLTGTTWTLAPGYPVNQTQGGIRYLTGRQEGADYVLFAVSETFAGQSQLVRHVAGGSGFTVLASSGANRWWRGVYLAPCDPLINGPCGDRTPSPFPTPSTSASSSVLPSTTSSASATRTATSSVTASGSVTSTATPTPTASLAAGVTPSPTASLTSSASATPSNAPYKFGRDSLVLWRLGSGASIASTTVAQPYFFDEVAVAPGGGSASVVRTVPVPGDGPGACTGALNTVAEGGPSLSWDGRYGVAPCFTAPVGTSAASTNASWPMRSIVRLAADSSLAFVRWSELSAGNIRGAATTDGINFWFNAGGNVRYIPADASLNDGPSGAVFTATAPPVIVTQTLTSFRGLSFVADGLDNPQLVTAYSASSATCGLYAVGAGAPTAAASMVQQLNCASFSMGTFISYHVVSPTTLWAVSTTALYKFVAAPRSGPLRFVGTTWTLAPGYPVAQTGGGGLRYITGRQEGADYVIYATTDVDAVASTTYLLRHVAGSSSFTVLLASGANRYFRGLFLPPCAEEVNGPCDGLSPTPFPTPSTSATATASNTASVSATSSVSASPSATNTATSSLSPGVSISSSTTTIPSATPSPTAAPWKFDAGNLVVWRLGSGAPMDPALAQPYFIDELAVAPGGGSASVVRTLPMPTDGPAACTGSLTTTYEGGLSNSFDGRFLVSACFTGPVGTASVQSTASFPQRQLNRVSAGSEMKFTRYPDTGTQNIRGAATVSGADYYLLSGGGVRFVAGDPSDATTPPGTVFAATNYSISVVIVTPTTFRSVSIAANTPDAPVLLLSWSASAASCGVQSVGNGVSAATSLLPAVTQLNGTTAVAGGMGTTMSHHAQDVNTLWVASLGALYKFVAAPRTGSLRLLGATWTLAPGYPVTPPGGGGLRYITGRQEGADYAVYAVTDPDPATGEGLLLRHAAGSATMAVLATSGANKQFRGVAFAPCDEAVNGPCAAAATPSPFPTPSNSPSSSVAPSSTASTSASRSATASGSRSRTPSGSATASVSSTASATPTPTGSLSGGVSVSATGSNTASASATPSNAPFKFSTSSIVVLRLGAGTSVPTTAVAMPLFLDEYAPAGPAPAALSRSVALPAAAGNRSCTGSLVGPLFEGGGALTHNGRFITLPCSPYPAGSISVFSSAYPWRGSVRVGAGSDVKLTRFNDTGTAQQRGVVSVDGTGPQLWVSGASARFLAVDPAMDASASGTQFSTPNQPVVLSMPGAFFRHATVVSDSPGVPLVVASYSASASACGLYALGAPGPIVNTTGQVATLLLNCTTAVPGGMGSFVGHHVQDVNTLWAASATALYKFVAAPRSGPLRFVGTTWTLAPGYPVSAGAGGLRYIVGRPEGADYVIYATTDVDAAASTTYLLRHVAGSSSFATLASSGYGKWFRGLYLPPCAEEVNGPCDGLSPSPFPTPSGTPTSSVPPSATASTSASRTATPSGTSSATPPPTPSGTGTPTRSGTPSPSGSRSATPPPTSSGTSSVSATASESGSVSATATPTASVSASGTGTPSSSQTGSGTPSSSQTGTGTPSSSQTGSGSGTPSSSQTGTGTPSSSQTGSATPPPTASGTPSRSRSGAPTSTKTPAPAAASPSRSRSRTATASRTKTRSRTRSPSKKKKLLRQ